MSSFGGFDPDRALDMLRKFAADAPSYVADGFGRVVQNAPPERLEQLMRSPARKPALDGIFWQMPQLPVPCSPRVRWEDLFYPSSSQNTCHPLAVPYVPQLTDHLSKLA